MTTRINIVDQLPTGSEGFSLWKNGHVTKCEVSRIYTCETGRLVIPIADEDGTPPIVVKTHSQFWWMEIVYDLERNGSTPVVPSWELDDQNLVLIEHKFTPYSPVPYDDALFKHRATGRYKFVMLREPRIASNDFMTCHAVYWLQGKAHYRTSNFSKKYAEWQ